MKLIGITGQMGAGKSAVSAWLGAQGYPVLDADQVARAISQPGGAAHARLVEHFGTAEPAELARLAFGSGRREELERILHPLIRAESDRWFAEVARISGAEIAFYEAALLFEAGRAADFDAIWLVCAPESVRLQRVIKTRGLTEAQARARMASQWSDERKQAEAKRLGVELVVIENAGTLEELDARLSSLIT